MIESNSHRYPDKYTWKPSDIEVDDETRGDDWRSDDDPLTDDELAQLEQIDDEPLLWDLPVEDVEPDGVLDTAEPDGIAPDWRADDLGHGYNPNRANDGKFAAGAHHEQHHAGGEPRQWRLAFDDRAHQKQIEAHRKTETVHRAKSLQLKEQMAALHARAAAAQTPKERATLQRQFDKLANKREQHRAAASEAKEAKGHIARQLEVDRHSHAEAQRAGVAERRGNRAARSTAEAESTMAIGQHRIRGAGEHEAEGSSPIPQRAETPEHHFAIGEHRVAGEPEMPHSEPGPAPKGKTSIWSPQSDRLAEQRQAARARPRETQEEWYQRTIESKRTPAERAMHAVSLPVSNFHTGLVAKAGRWLRRRLGGGYLGDGQRHDEHRAPLPRATVLQPSR